MHISLCLKKEQTLASGITTLGEGADLTRLGAEQLTGATGAYDPYFLQRIYGSISRRGHK